MTETTVKMEMKGERIAKRYGFKLIPHFFNLIYILDNWDSLPIGKRVVSLYSYREKDFIQVFRKYDEKIGIANVNYVNLHVIKNNEGFEIIVYNVDINMDYKTRSLLRLFLGNIFEFREGKVYLYKRIIKNLVKSHDLKLKIRKINLVKVKPLFDNTIITYYPRKEIIRNSIVLGKDSNGNLYVITEINNKKASYYVKRINRIPRINRIALENHKIQYQFFKTLLQRGILQKENIFPIIPLGILRVIGRHEWKFSPLYIFNEQLVRADFDVRLMAPVLIDYDYDETNQVLLKFVDERYHSILCGLDYKNTLWCITLPAITQWWKIKEVYKYVYDLDNETKVFNY